MAVGFVVACLCAALLLGNEVLLGDEMRLKNGTVLEGRTNEIRSMVRGPRNAPQGPIEFFPIWEVSTDLQRYYVSRHQVANIAPGGELRREEKFELKQPARPSALAIQSVGPVLSVTPFDKLGQRTIRLAGLKDPIIQGISSLTPTIAVLKSVRGQQWDTAIATSSIPVEQLDPILRQASKQDDPDHRLAIVRFHILSQQYALAEKELLAVRQAFPTLLERADEILVELRQSQATQILGELRLRQNAGQHRLVRYLLEQFPARGVNATILAQVDELRGGYVDADQRLERVKVLLGEAEAGVKDDKVRGEARPFRTDITEKVSLDTLPRLDAFLKLSEDDSLSSEDKLALALSGWVVGSENAVGDLPLALRLCRARGMAVDYRQSREAELPARQGLLEELKLLDGVDVARLAQIVRRLPPVDFGAAPIAPQTPTRVTLLDGADEYVVTLPPEYNPDRDYPLIVCLHGPGATPENELEFWAGSPAAPGQAARHGYVVIAPEFAAAGQSAHDYLARTHLKVLACLTDAMRRFSVDSDRVFLVGHGLGADAVFDIGFAHPDLFAGLVPLGGVSAEQCRFTWSNAKNLPIYIVAGELDGKKAETNTRELDRFFRAKDYDVVYCEFRGAGYGAFYDEILKLFQWMSARRRGPAPREFEYNAMRVSDTRAWWLAFSGLPEKVLVAQTNPLAISGKINAGNTVHIQCRTRALSLWLSPEFVDFQQKLQVKVNQSQKWNDFLVPDPSALLEDLRRRGDRAHPMWAVLDL